MCSAPAAGLAHCPKQRDLLTERQNLLLQHELLLSQELAQLPQRQHEQQAAEAPQQCTGGQQPHPQPLREHDQQLHQQRRQQHPHQHQPHQSQQHHAQPHASQQKAILPGMLASLVQTQRSSQRTFLPKPSRPPLGPSAPSKCRRDADAADASAADSTREGSGTSQPGGSSLLQQARAAKMLPPLQRRPPQPQQQQHRQAAQQRSGHVGRAPPRHLSVQVPVADPVHVQLHGFFSRRRRLLQQLGRRPSRYTRPPQAGPRSGLLALPEDVLVSVTEMTLYWQL